jgi:hypothetical protein
LGSYIYISPDGVTWNPASQQGYSECYVVYNGQLNIFLPGGGTLITSTDGTTFDSQSISLSYNPTKIIVFNGTCIAISNNDKYHTSTDLTDWTDFTFPPFDESSTLYILDIQVIDNILYAFGYYEKHTTQTIRQQVLLKSPDSSSWSYITMGDSIGTQYINGSSIFLTGLSYGQQLYMLTDVNGNTITKEENSQSWFLTERIFSNQLVYKVQSLNSLEFVFMMDGTLVIGRR